MVFYKLSFIEFKDFEEGKTIAIPSKDPYNLFTLEAAKQFDSALQFTLNDLRHFTYDFKCLRDTANWKYYIMAAPFKDYT